MKVTFLGLGKMGQAMVSSLLEAKYSLTVWNRTKEKALGFENLGAKIAASIKDAVSDADVVMSCVIDDKALTALCDEMLPDIKNGAVHISTSTILPSTATQLANLHLENECDYIAAPVLGVPSVVRQGAATTFCSGKKEIFDSISPLLESYAKTVQYIGEKAALANVLKLSMNYTLVTTIELISELYVFAEKNELDTKIVKESLQTIYAHPGVKYYIDKVHARDFDNVNFDMRGGNKDVSLFHHAFREVGVVPSLANAVQDKFIEALACGMEDKDWSAIAEVVRKRAGLKG